MYSITLIAVILLNYTNAGNLMLYGINRSLTPKLNAAINALETFTDDLKCQFNNLHILEQAHIAAFGDDDDEYEALSDEMFNCYAEIEFHQQALKLLDLIRKTELTVIDCHWLYACKEKLGQRVPGLKCIIEALLPKDKLLELTDLKRPNRLTSSLYYQVLHREAMRNITNLRASTVNSTDEEASAENPSKRPKYKS